MLPMAAVRSVSMQPPIATVTGVSRSAALFLFASATTIPLYACDDGADDDARADGDASQPDARDGQPHAAALDAACTQLAQTMCARREECSACSMQARYGDAQDCAEIERQLCMAQLSLADADADPDGVRQARDLIAEATCARLDAPVRVTTRPGARRRGAGCAADAQCAAELWCSGTPEDGCGSCQNDPPAERATGDSCQEPPEPWNATGDPCGSALGGPDVGACAPSDICALPDSADPHVYDGYKVCKPRPGLGDSCRPYQSREFSICPSALVCADFVCRAELACLDDPSP
jgi:hypothetical protein